MDRAPLLGRAPVLDRADRLLADCRIGRGALLWLHGDAGIGKTRVLDEIAHRAGGFQVLRASGWEDAGTPAFWLWTQVLRAAAALRPPSEWSERAAAARALLASQPAVAGDHSDRFPLFDAVDAVLDDLAADAPVLLVLDDLHWVDAGSLRLLRFVATTLGARPVLVACGWRDHDLAPEDDRRPLADELTTRADAWLLDGLGDADVRTLVGLTVGTEPDDAETSELVMRTGGNPLFVSETARLARARGTALAGLVPTSAQATIRRRVARLPQPVAETLATAAILGGSSTWQRLAELSDVSPAELTEHVDTLVDAGLLRHDGDRIDFTHALVRDAVYDAIPATRRRERHLDVARQLAQSGAGAAERAQHLLSAVPLADGAAVVAATEQAARDAAAVHAYEDAVQWCTRAQDAAGAWSPRGAELALLHGEMLLAIGNLDAARAQFQSVAAIGRGNDDPELVARAALGFASGLSGFEVRLWDGAQTELLEEALALLGDDDSALRVLVLARLSVALSFSASDDRRAELAEAAVAMGRRVGEPAALAAALAAHCDTVSGPAYSELRAAEASEVVELAHRVRDPGLELLGLRLRIIARWEQGSMSAAALDQVAFERLAARLRQPFYSWYVPLWRGARAHLAGDLATMTANAAEAERLGSLGGSRNAVVLALIQRAWPLFERGLPGEAMATVLELFPNLPELAGDGGSWVRLFPGQPPEVQTAALAELPRLLADLPVDSEWVSAIAAAAEGLHQRGERLDAPARLLYDALVPYAHRFMVDGIGAALTGSVQVSLAQLAAVFGDDELADRHFAAAEIANGLIEAPLPRARAQRIHAEVLRRRGRADDDTRRRDLVEQSLAFYRRAGITERVTELEALHAGVASGASAAAAVRGTLRRDGGFWTVGWDGSQAVLPAVKGIADLAVLLRQPEHEVHALDLVGAPAELRSDLGPILDDTARDAYRARLVRLDDELAEAERSGDAAGSERAAQERDALLAELSAAYGLGGRARRAGDPAERARTTVTSRVRDAIARIDAQLPQLGRHLRASVRTGVYCCYAPETPTAWEIGPTM